MDVKHIASVTRRLNSKKPSFSDVSSFRNMIFVKIMTFDRISHCPSRFSRNSRCSRDGIDFLHHIGQNRSFSSIRWRENSRFLSFYNIRQHTRIAYEISYVVLTLLLPCSQVVDFCIRKSRIFQTLSFQILYSEVQRKPFAGSPTTVEDMEILQHENVYKDLKITTRCISLQQV